ncbi:hypothetical protein MB02_01205 [Croceicoccus estronivorus]|uniref:hypothetical protein n=1 Tax=Croceicoccus estronivorus TaxID=1172626 RepID=UPI00082D80B9|nr:hypothetical protein [Croceicoccus estronivorus]OCC25320.1 hypothetical protein MB02_01205 [Croceicoccus estronivorus]
MIYAFGIVFAALLFADVLLTAALIGAGQGHRFPIANLLYNHAYATFGVMAQKAIVGACGIWLALHFGHWWLMAAILLLQALIVWRKSRLLRRIDEAEWAAAKDEWESIHGKRD